MAHSDGRRRRDRGHNLSGTRLLGLLGSGRQRNLLPGHDGKTGNRFFQLDYPSHYASVRSGERSSPGSTGIGHLFGQEDNSLHTTSGLSRSKHYQTPHVVTI